MRVDDQSLLCNISLFYSLFQMKIDAITSSSMHARRVWKMNSICSICRGTHTYKSQPAIIILYTYPGVKIDVIALELIYDLVETEVLDLHSIQNMTYQLPLKCLMFMFRNYFIIFVKNNKLAHLEYIFNFIIEINLNFYVASFRKHSETSSIET